MLISNLENRLKQVNDCLVIMVFVENSQSLQRRFTMIRILKQHPMYNIEIQVCGH